MSCYTANMKATIDVPDGLYRRVKARSALEGRSIRDVTIVLFERWIAETPDSLGAVDDPDRSAASLAWRQRWDAIGSRVAKAAPSERTTRDVLVADRRR